MTRRVNTKLTSDIARELAGSKAYIAGSIANLGNEYVLGLKTVDCQSGEPLAQEQMTANGKEKILDATGDAAAKLRGQLGESLATAQKLDVPMREATTSSLEALQAYSSFPVVKVEGLEIAQPMTTHSASITMASRVSPPTLTDLRLSLFIGAMNCLSTSTQVRLLSQSETPAA